MVVPVTVVTGFRKAEEFRVLTGEWLLGANPLHSNPPPPPPCINLHDLCSPAPSPPVGSGKTTLVNRILKEQHGMRIAVIENEFGEVGGRQTECAGRAPPPASWRWSYHAAPFATPATQHFRWAWTMAW